MVLWVWMLRDLEKWFAGPGFFEGKPMDYKEEDTWKIRSFTRV